MESFDVSIDATSMLRSDTTAKRCPSALVPESASTSKGDALESGRTDGANTGPGAPYHQPSKMITPGKSPEGVLGVFLQAIRLLEGFGGLAVALRAIPLA